MSWRGTWRASNKYRRHFRRVFEVKKRAYYVGQAEVFCGLRQGYRWPSSKSIVLPARKGARWTEPDFFYLECFVMAPAPVFETVLAELRAGRNRTHQMWLN